MTSDRAPTQQPLPSGVMLNAYPDSIGSRLSDVIELLKRPEFKDTFSLFYILPTFFNSDLDRGFSVIDYDINRELVSPKDLEELDDRVYEGVPKFFAKYPFTAGSNVPVTTDK